MTRMTGRVGLRGYVQFNKDTYIHTYITTVVMLGCDWWRLCMVINISVQYTGGLLPDIILLTHARLLLSGEPV